MPRPKKSPRVRLQIVFERDQAKSLRAFAKQTDRDISQVVRVAVADYVAAAKAAAWQHSQGLDS